MALSEKTIFNYVFFRESLTKEQIVEVESSSDFHETVAFFASLKEYLNEDIPDKIKIKIAEKIPAYSYKQIITLLPLKAVDNKRKINFVRYAAASGADELDSVLTFCSDNKNYIIRLHKLKDKYKVYVFSTIEKDLKNYELTFYPSEEIITLKDNQNPFLITLNQIPDKIDMRLN